MPRLRTPWLVLLAILPVVLGQATTLVHLSLAQLCRASALIVRARATGQQYGWNADHSGVVTLTTFAVENVEKGSAPGTLVVEQPGGIEGNVQMRVDGTARFYPLASYVLFLEPSHSGPDRLTPVGMMQGAFRIYRDAGSGIEHVIPPVPRAWRVMRGAGGAAVAAPTLSQFEAHVRDILNCTMTIPRGVTLQVALASSQRPSGANRAAPDDDAAVAVRHRCPGGRGGSGDRGRAVEGRTVGTVFPNSDLVIPAGSVLKGEACREIRGWRIQWTSLEIRGEKAKFAGVTNLAAGGWLTGPVLRVIAE